MLNARSKFSMQMPKIQKKKKRGKKSEIEERNDIQLYMYKPQWNTSLLILSVK